MSKTKKMLMVASLIALGLVGYSNKDLMVDIAKNTVYQTESLVLDVVDLVKPEPKPILVFKIEDRSIELFDSRCKDKDVLAEAKEQGAPLKVLRNLKRVDATFHGTKSQACYLHEKGESTAMVIDVTLGYAGSFSLEDFVKPGDGPKQPKTNTEDGPSDGKFKV